MRPDRQSGFALATAIFLVVVLAALGLVILSVSGLQHVSSARDVMGSKAYQAARAGIEWGAYRVLQQGLPGNCPAATTTFAMPAGDLSGFSVSVTCVETNNDEAARTGVNALEFYVITSTACNQAPCPNSSPGAAYVERQIQATIGR